MALTQFTTDISYIAALPDSPTPNGGFSKSQLKAEFDKAGNALKTFINDTMIAEIELELNNKSNSSEHYNKNDLNSTVGGSSGADKIGVTAIDGLSGTTAQTVLESVGESLSKNTDLLGVENKNLGVAVSLKHYNTSETDKLDTYKSQALSLKNINSHVEMVCFITVPSVNSTTFSIPDITNLITPFITYCNTNSIKISLVKIHLVRELDVSHFPDDSATGLKGTIAPANGEETTWFTNYQTALTSLITACVPSSCERFVIANENQALTTNRNYVSYWNTLIQGLKTSFPTLKFGVSTLVYEQKWIEFEKRNNRTSIANYLDFLGINIYPKMSYQTTYSSTESTFTRKQILKEQVKYIGMLYSLFKPLEIVITECGSMGRLNSLNMPIDESMAYAKDSHVAGVYLDMALNELANRDYIKGFYIWHVREPFMFLGTEAEQIVSDYYGRWNN